MRVFDESFELREFVVNMPFMLTCRMMKFLSLLLLGLWMLVVFAVCAVRIVRVVSEVGTTLSMCCVCVGSAVAVGVTIVVFNVTWVFVADGELTGTGGSAAFEVRGVVLAEGVLCEVCICRSARYSLKRRQMCYHKCQTISTLA